MLHSQDFGFGETKTASEAEIINELQDLIANLSSKGPLMIVFHGATDEKKYLDQELNTIGWHDFFPGNIHKPLSANSNSKGKEAVKKFPIVIQDTQRLYAAYRGDPQYAQVVLKRACEETHIDARKMYNAGGHLKRFSTDRGGRRLIR